MYSITVPVVSVVLIDVEHIKRKIVTRFLDNMKNGKEFNTSLGDDSDIRRSTCR